VSGSRFWGKGRGGRDPKEQFDFAVAVLPRNRKIPLKKERKEGSDYKPEKVNKWKRSGPRLHQLRTSRWEEVSGTQRILTA